MIRGGRCHEGKFIIAEGRGIGAESVRGGWEEGLGFLEKEKKDPARQGNDSLGAYKTCPET